jgi:ribose 5-phosphate isomerase B
MTSKIFIGSDHAGLKIKKEIMKLLDKNLIAYEDIGTFGGNPNDDYPDYAFEVAKKVTKTKNAKGILICGSGTGMVIAANKVKGIRAALAYDHYSAKMARNDNDVNVLCLRGRFTAPVNTKRIVTTWLKTPFSKLARHKKRINKISDYEKKGK